MILSDSEIIRRIKEGSIVIKTTDDYDIIEQVGPASLDFRLGNVFKFYKKGKLPIIDINEKVDSKYIETVEVSDDEGFILHPGHFVLGVTKEYIGVPDDLVARCEGRSSMGRLGIVIHSTAGFIDPGFEGTITLEMTNINELPIKIYPGMRIGQFAFETLEGKCETPYNVRKGSKYVGQVLPEESRVNSDLY